MRRLLRLNFALALLATAVVLLWIRAVGGFQGVAGAAIAPLPVAIMLVLTGLCVLVRFLRWQFLMRHAGSRLIERSSLRIYLASLVGTATPAYVGEAIRGAFIRREFGVPLRVSLFVLVVERLLDVLALALIAGVAADSWWLRGVMALAFGGAILALVVASLLAPAIGLSSTVRRIVRRPDIVRDAFVLSIVAWGLTAFDMSLAASSLGLSVPLLDSVRVFSSSVLLGGLTLMPAGIGSAGAFAIVQLEHSGVPLPSAFMVVSLVRLATVGATLLVGAVCLLALLRRNRAESTGDAAAHFDDIAAEYGDQFQPHVWQHLLERKVGLIAGALPPPAASRGLDLGCGLGSQCLALARRGYRVFGMDVARKLAAQAHEAGASVTAGSALALPFRDRCLDFVYAVGVLHHLPNRQAQRVAYEEVARVLKPGGVFVVHETNTRNPLFRLYMGYVFPLLKTIDEGTEWWIEPDRWKGIPGLRLVRIDHFTFMPDFIPSWLMTPVLAVDRWLERSWLRPYSVHYMAVLECDPTWSPVVVDARFADDERPADPARWPAANETGR
jgi:SAM-dependent methyltransferase/uncharacterized membrane protein YbhN (UPF0104 family)